MGELPVRATGPCLSCLYFRMVLHVPRILQQPHTGLRVLVWRIICCLMGNRKAKKGLPAEVGQGGDGLDDL